MRHGPSKKIISLRLGVRKFRQMGHEQKNPLHDEGDFGFMHAVTRSGA